MPGPDLYRYQLILEGSENSRRIALKKQEGQQVRFRHPVTESRRSKLYVLKKGEKVLYVGYTSQSMSARLSSGFWADGRYGYHGYKWKQLDAVELLVFVCEPLPPEKSGEIKQKLFYEAVEAELVYLIRTHTGQWPEYQHEIHFNSEEREEVLVLARELYGRIQEG